MVLVSVMNVHGVVVVASALVLSVFVALGVPGGQEDSSPVESASVSSGQSEDESPDADVPAWVSAEVRALIELSMQAGGEGPNDYQEGENGDCLDFNVLYEVSGVDSPLAAIVDVDPETGYVVDSSAGAAHIDFRNDDGDNLGYNLHETNGNVPEGATYGILCVAMTNSYPDVPEAFATWFYMDGFPTF